MKSLKHTIINNLRYLKLRYQKKLCNLPFRSVAFHVDSDVSFSIVGWIYLEKDELDSVKLSFFNEGKSFDGFDVAVNREEVSKECQNYLHLHDGQGVLYRFDIKCAYESSLNTKVILYLEINEQMCTICVGELSSNISRGKLFRFCCAGSHNIVSANNDPSVISFENNADDVRPRKVDIVLPIYNGFEYFEALFSSIEKTSLDYSLIIIDDCSPDERVRKFLDVYSNRPEVTLLRNEHNLGFVKSVNSGLKEATGDVVLLNTDTELPEGWLERLMLPIWVDDTIASVTPFTNSGTICSFPNFCQDNELPNGFCVDTIDAYFRKLEPKGYVVPTGVGFCMAMSREAIEKVGLLDEERFGKGFGEENDWCQRAINAGFQSVHLNNLFVYHKHGGSFDDEEKNALCLKNSEVLSSLHPDYFTDVDFYIMSDPAYDDRALVSNMIAIQQNNQSSAKSACRTDGDSEFDML